MLATIIELYNNVLLLRFSANNNLPLLGRRPVGGRAELRSWRVAVCGGRHGELEITQCIYHGTVSIGGTCIYKYIVYVAYIWNIISSCTSDAFATLLIQCWLALPTPTMNGWTWGGRALLRTHNLYLFWLRRFCAIVKR